MDPSSEHSSYQVYLLRVWQAQAAGSERKTVWRFSLEDTQTKQRRGFASLEEMVAFLSESLDRPAAVVPKRP